MKIKEKFISGDMATDAELLTNQAADRDRTNHTGTQPSSTISDFAGTVRTTFLSGLAAGTNAVIDATDQLITALAKLQAQISNNKTRLDNTLARVRQGLVLTPTTISPTTYAVVGGRFVWNNSRNTKYLSGIMLYKVSILSADRLLSVRLVCVTTGTVLAENTGISVTGTYTLAFTNPPSTSEGIELQALRTAGGALANSPSVDAAILEFTTKELNQ